MPADLGDPDGAEAAIARLEQQAGPVSAVFHLATAGPPTACGELSGPDVRSQVAHQSDQLSNVLGAVSAAGLRLLVTLGPATARYGAAGYCATALTATALAEQAQRLRPGLTGCRIMHADLAGLAGGPPGQSARLGQPEPPGAAANPPAGLAEQGELLLGMLAGQSGPDRIAIHGRAPRGGAGQYPAGRALPGDPAGALPRRRADRRGAPVPADRPLPGRVPDRRADGAAPRHRPGSHGPGRVGAGWPAVAAAGRGADARAGAAARRPGMHSAGLRAAPSGLGRDCAALRGQRLPGRPLPGPVPAAGRGQPADRPGWHTRRPGTPPPDGRRARWDRRRNRPVRPRLLPGRPVPPGSPSCPR